MGGKKVTIKGPRDAIRAGIAYLPEDRRELGLALGMTVDENIPMASMSKFSSFGFIQFAKSAANSEKQRCLGYVHRPYARKSSFYPEAISKSRIGEVANNCDVIILMNPQGY